MKKKILFSAGVLIALIGVFYLFGGNEDGSNTDILTTVKKGDFEVRIVTTGELEAKNSVQIMGPTRLHNYRIYQVNIQSIAPEGKVVKKGDWIASLDPSELTTKISDAQTRLDQEESRYTTTQLDTMLDMRKARDELINLKYAVEEKQIVLEQSQFEPPATIKQAEIAVDKARRAYDQAKDNYKIKHQQNRAKMISVMAALNKARRELSALEELKKGFTIRAPEDGMLIYRKGWDGRAIKEGSQINAWDPVVATLPDLSVMLSKTYVNEVDVRKVKPGQLVEIGLDAFPQKKLTGKVIKVANIGEQRPNSDAKVFRVDIQLDGTDKLLKPSMTTSNVIITKSLEDVLHIPLEALHNQSDSITYVYKKSGLDIVKQEVMIGVTNSDEAVILAGLEEDDRLYLSTPSSAASTSVNLIPEMDGKRTDDPQEDVEPEGMEKKNVVVSKGGGKERTKKANK